MIEFTRDQRQEIIQQRKRPRDEDINPQITINSEPMDQLSQSSSNHNQHRTNGSTFTVFS